VAAGDSRRMGGVDKIFAALLGKPLLTYAIDAFEDCPHVEEVVLVLSPDKLEEGRHLAKEQGWKKVSSICQGGPRRQDSVKLGLERLNPCQWVVVHDGARPCIETELVARGLEAAGETGGAVAAIPVSDTIKVVSPSGLIEHTPDRQSLWLVQTPQVFRYELLMEAHRSCSSAVTDDAAMVEELGHQVKVFLGSHANLKVTTPEDLSTAEGLLRARLDSQSG